MNTSQGVPSCLKPKSLGLAGSAWLARLGWLGLAGLAWLGDKLKIPARLGIKINWISKFDICLPNLTHFKQFNQILTIFVYFYPWQGVASLDKLERAQAKESKLASLNWLSNKLKFWARHSLGSEGSEISRLGHISGSKLGFSLGTIKSVLAWQSEPMWLELELTPPFAEVFRHYVVVNTSRDTMFLFLSTVSLNVGFI